MQLRFRRAIVRASWPCCCWPRAPAHRRWASSSAEGTDAPAASAIEDDGMLRVYLKSLGDPASLGMTLAGSYTVEGDRGFRFDARHRHRAGRGRRKRAFERGRPHHRHGAIADA